MDKQNVRRFKIILKTTKMKNLKISIAAMLLLVSLTNAQEKEKMNHDHSKMNMDGMSMDNMQMTPEFKSKQLAVS